MPLPRNLGLRERILRVAASAAFLVVALTIVHIPAVRYALFLLSVLSFSAAVSGYGPAYKYVSRLRGKPRESTIPNDDGVVNRRAESQVHIQLNR